MSITNAFNRIGREAGVKRGIIVEGNVGDVFLVDRKPMGIKDALSQTLKAVDYRDIVLWDRISGLEETASFLKITEETEQSEGEEYDLGDIEIPEPSKAGSFKDPGDMFHVIYNTLKDGRSATAFILDWSEYLFSTGGQLDPIDRENLTVLGKAIRDTVPRYRGNERQSVVIIVASKASMIPLSFYSNNPEVSVVTISRPDMDERRSMLKKVSTGFSLRDEDDITDSPNFEDYVDMTNDFTNREIIQMANMSRNEGDLTFEKLYYLFKYGEKENPWEKLDPDKVRTMKSVLRKRVIGQDQAIEHVFNTIVKAFMGLTGMHKTSSRSMPKGVFFFVGPTGVGKTELSKAIAKFLFGDDSACIRFDMSEYSQENSDQKLIGAPPGYVGFEEGGQLTNAIREKPFSVVLFDEVEKAAKPNPRILDIFLQILEDGRLTDNRGETTYFSDTVIIFTSNLGASEVRNGPNSEVVFKEFIDIVKDYFDNELKRPEILGRIGYENIVPFNFINDPSFARNILKSKIQPIKEGIQEKYGIELRIKNEGSFGDYILSGADVSKGGRDILNVLDSRLLNPLSVFLFENYDDLSRLRGSILYTIVKDGSLEFEFD